MLELPDAAGPQRTRPRRMIAVVISAVALIAVTVGAFLIPSVRSGASEGPEPTTDLATVRVTAGDMVAETRVPGSIAYALTVEVTAGRAGVITELPAPGAPLGVGSVLYRVDALPVILLAGALPAWRDFSSDMTDGADVLQLEQNLAAFGMLTEEPDARFDWDTTVAVRDWQRSLGLERTGTLERSQVLFGGGALRVDSVTARLGQDVGPGTVVLRATSLDLVVDVAVRSSDRSLAVSGQSVTITLPDGSTTEGVIQTVGAPVSQPDVDGAGNQIVIPVRIGVADQEAIAGLALASVTAGFASTLRDDVLTVPVDALVPLDEERYAVEVPPSGDSDESRLMPVTVGAVTSGKVEISGAGIVEGLRVVVPSR